MFTRSFRFLALGFALLCIPLLLSSRIVNYAADELDFHLPAVRQIRAHWPQLDLQRDSLSAISPGYHYFLATVSFATGVNRLPLRMVNWGLSLAVLAVLWHSFPRGFSPLAFAAVLPLACSNFFVKSASWIVTDNPGLLAVCVVLAQSFAPSSRVSTWRIGIAAAAATFVRQLHVWTAFSVAGSAWQEARTRSGAARLLVFLPALLPLGLLGMLVWAWKGLVPPQWQTISYVQNTSPTASLCYLGAVFFIFGVFYCATVSAENLQADLASKSVRAAAVAGLIIALVGRTDYNIADGRWGGYLWAIASHLPAPGGRSLLFTLLTPLGTALLALMVLQLARQCGRSPAMLWFGSYCAWASTFLPNRLVFHRYYEPMTLVFLIFWSALMARSSPAASFRPGRLRALALAQLLITLGTAHYQTFLHSAPPG